MSARLDDGRILVSASGTRLEVLEGGDFVLCSPTGAFGGPRRPSKELPLHRAVYHARPDVNAVLHGAGFHSTLAACTDLEVPNRAFVEAMYYLERVARVPYRHPGSDALAAEVAARASAADVMLLEGHGTLAFDTSVEEALQALETLEFACRMALGARAAGVTVVSLPEVTVRDFLEHAGYRPRRHSAKNG